MQCYKRVYEINFLILELIFHRGVKNQKLKTKKEVGEKTHFLPQIFFLFQRKMELEDQKKNEELLNSIILWEGRIIQAQNDYMSSKKTFEYEIKRAYRQIAFLKRMALLKQQGLKWSCPADDIRCDEESEKELQRWKNFTPGEKIREHREQIGMLQNDEDWEPMTDIQVDRWIEKETEKHG